jgi:hypothetical protein
MSRTLSRSSVADIVVAVKSYRPPSIPGMIVSNAVFSNFSFSPSFFATRRARSGFSPIGVELSSARNVIGGELKSIATVISPLDLNDSGNNATAAASG